MLLEANSGNLALAPAISFPPPELSIFNFTGSYIISESVRLYVEGGVTPSIVSIGTTPVLMVATVTGYLIDCSGQNVCAAIVPGP
jgi:hypothetical protein